MGAEVPDARGAPGYVTVAIATFAGAVAVFGLALVALNTSAASVFSHTFKLITFGVAVATATSGTLLALVALAARRPPSADTSDPTPDADGANQADEAPDGGHAGDDGEPESANGEADQPAPLRSRLRSLRASIRRVSARTARALASIGRRVPARALQLSQLMVVVSMLATGATALGKPSCGCTRRVSTQRVAVNVKVAGGVRVTLHGAGSSSTASGVSAAVFGALGGLLGKLPVGSLEQLVAGIAKGHLTLSPHLDIGSVNLSFGHSPPAPPASSHVNFGGFSFSFGGSSPVRQPTDCASYFVALDELLEDEPQIGRFLPAPTGTLASDCHLTRTTYAQLLQYLAKR